MKAIVGVSKSKLKGAGTQMINLMIEEQCENCPSFEVEQESVSAFDICSRETNVHHILRCKNEGLCQNIKMYINNDYCSCGERIDNK